MNSIPHDPEFDELIEDPDDNQHRRRMAAGISAWMFSAGLHLAVALILGAIIFVGLQQSDAEPVRPALLEPLPQPDRESPPDRALDPVLTELEVEDISDVSVTIDVEVPVEDIETPDDVVVEQPQPKGRQEAQDASEMGGVMSFNAIGASGAAGGPFGHRTGGDKRQALNENGGDRRTQNAVLAALRWFTRHQGPDGRWSVDGYQLQCADDPKCEPGEERTGAHGDGDVACTAYALLCFLGDGHDHRMAGQFQHVVQRGLDYLVDQVEQRGAAHIGKGRNYEIGIVAMALAEAYAMTLDPALKAPAQELIDVIADRQLIDADGYGLGWDYTRPKATRVDASVSGWCVMAAKSAAAGGLNVRGIMDGAKAYIDRAWKLANPDWQQLDPYTGHSGFPYTWNTETGEVEKHETGGNQSRAPIGALMAVFLGRTQGDVMLETLCNYIADKQQPTGYPTNTYYLYYNMLAIFQAGGERWRNWNRVVGPMLVDSQRKGDGCHDGSWDWEGTGFHGHRVGRLLSTAYMCLSLEVYYRYERVGVADRL